jgi:hypothetical protein
MDMNIFLAVDEKGVKLATKEPFWKVATPDMWAVDPKLIWDFMRKNGWIQKDIKAASRARSNQTPEVKAQRQMPEVKARRKARRQTPEVYQQEKEKAFQQAVAGKNMNVFLAVDENGVKLATKPQFWKEATPEMWAVEPKLIWEFMRKNGWIQKDINAVMKARSNQTPEVKARRAAREKTPETKAKRKTQRQMPEVKARRAAREKTPETKAKRNSRQRKRRKTDPEFKLRNNLRDNFNRIKKFLIEANVMTEEEVKHFKQNCKDNDSYYAQHFRCHLEKTLPDGVTWMDWTGNKTDLQIDHVFPVMQAVKNSELFPGLLEFVQSPWNVMFLDMETNLSKSDKIILELIPQNCPGYPFAGAEVFTTIEEAGLPRVPFEKWLEIKKILETL